MKIKFTFLFSLIGFISLAQTGWQQITSFGTNPGNLKMYLYVPVGISGNAPVVVAMHGCTQNAVQCRDNTGWNDLADRYKFYVIYPEQQAVNNSSTCFNWFLPGDQNRDGGEALSIKQMADYVQSHYTVDILKVFTTGLSAGAAMSAVMLACYPDVFSAGAIMSGGPYKSATDAITASSAMYGLVNKTPTEWMNLVLGAFPGYNGVYPRVVIFHGLNDNVVYPANINESVEQWTAVHNISQTAIETNSSFLGNPDIEQAIYKNPSGDTVVLTYRISNMYHAIAVDPGTGAMQGGTTGTYSVDKNFYSSYWAAEFFRITSISTGIDHLFTNDQILIYPNPAQNSISVQQNTKINIDGIQIYNLNGEKLFFTNNQQIDISVLSTGTYIAEIYYNKSKIVRQLITKQ